MAQKQSQRDIMRVNSNILKLAGNFDFNEKSQITEFHILLKLLLKLRVFLDLI